MRSIIYCVSIIFFSCWAAGCNKTKFLDEKQRTDQIVPTTLDDFQLLLDNDAVMSETPVLGELSSDNIYTTQNYWQLLTPKEQNAYIWAEDTYKGEEKIGDWNFPYEQVFYANVIIEGLKKLPPENDEQRWKHIRGSALFIRSYAFFNLAQIFAPAYNEATANEDLGIPLRVTPNIDEKTQRSTVLETYNQIITDLTEATQLLLEAFPTDNRNRPSKIAAYAQLARVYLSMRKYDKALLYADSCLLKYQVLIDYNELNATLFRPFDRKNVETIYQSKQLISSNLIKAVPTCFVDTNLYKSYANNDLRRIIFFQLNANNFPNPKGGYNGTTFAFSGLATDEMFLIRAECYARAGNTNAALTDLNTLLHKRWRTGTFVSFTASSAGEALNLILRERRKELFFRGLRWIDLRRLNLEGAGIKLTRKLENTTYELTPNSKLYVLPIPPDVIRLGGIIQNDRK
jgi:starch-binding outer membrane protein, SusD/RagB family